MDLNNSVNTFSIRTILGRGGISTERLHMNDVNFFTRRLHFLSTLRTVMLQLEGKYNLKRP